MCTPGEKREGSLTRRKLINAILSITGLATLISFLTPVVAYLLPLDQDQLGTTDFQTADGMSILPGDIAEGTGIVGSLSGRPTLIVLQNGQFLAFDAVCSHLGCIVRWNTTKGAIECPCHGGVFNLEGNVTAGPPPSPLDQVALNIQGDRILKS